MAVSVGKKSALVFFSRILVTTVCVLVLLTILVSCSGGKDDPPSPPTYTVTFNSQSATVEANPTSKTVTSPATTVVTLPTPPTKTGYILGGWYTAPSGGGTEFTATTTVTANITVYAKWDSYTYTVTFDSQSATADASPSSKTVTSPATTVVTLPTPPTKTSYTFAGWYTAPGGGGTEFTASTTVATSITVYAKWNAPVGALPKTGQTVSYSTRDDGVLQKGIAWPSPRFTDNGNGTVTDNLTGLIWLKNANCFGTRTWANALNDANTLNSGECGLTDGSVEGDWRMPNINEMESLINVGAANTATWLNTQGFSSAQGNWYWSSTANARGPINDAWYVRMLYGETDLGNKGGSSAYIWPVRAGLSGGVVKLPKTGQTTSYATGDDGDLERGVDWPSPRFTDNGNGTITDNLTGLIWLKNANCFGTRTWTDALNDANTLNSGECGLTDGSAEGDWRLPNRKELNSHGNYSQANPSTWLNTQGFSSVADTYWSSSSVAAVAGSAWYVMVVYDVVYDVSKGVSYYVWPVRGG